MMKKTPLVYVAGGIDPMFIAPEKTMIIHPDDPIHFSNAIIWIVPSQLTTHFYRLNGFWVGDQLNLHSDLGLQSFVT
jgi:hypothetical protein